MRRWMVPVWPRRGVAHLWTLFGETGVDAPPLCGTMHRHRPLVEPDDGREHCKRCLAVERRSGVGGTP